VVNGVWRRSKNSIDPHGRFVDFLSAGGNSATGGGPVTANQTFSASGGSGNLNVQTEANPQFQTTLANVYGLSSMTIAGVGAPRQCVSGVDPTMN